MRDMVKPTLSLLIICFGVTLCLALVNGMTKDVISQRAAKDAEQQRKQVMDNATSFKELADWPGKSGSGIIRDVYAAYNGEKLAGYVFNAFPKGYGGEISLTVGVSAEEIITGVMIGDNSETPGMGSKAADDSFKGQYTGKSAKDTLKVVKRAPAADDEIQAISGATITSKAVTSGVQASMDLAEKLLADGGK